MIFRVSGFYFHEKVEMLDAICGAGCVLHGFSVWPKDISGNKLLAVHEKW